REEIRQLQEVQVFGYIVESRQDVVARHVSLRTVVLLLGCVFLCGIQMAARQSPAGTVTLPAGTQILVRTVDAVDSENSQPNQRFRGTLEANLMADNVLVAPKGTTVFGRLITAQAVSGRSGGRLEFDLTDIQINGQTYSLA